ncbi:MAG TPA: hypothetical protein ENH82_16995, partial [bacterium]|nr:hypothetical protein [bacterium]
MFLKVHSSVASFLYTVSLVRHLYGDKSWYKQLTGSGGNNDFFVLNKDAVDIMKPPELKKEIVEEKKPPAAKGGPAALKYKTPEEQKLSAKQWEVKMPLEAEAPETINKTQILQSAETSFGVPIKGKATHKWKSAGGFFSSTIS